jgi:signal transduction histidine kinase/CheY-like chemotaxis protein
MMTCTKQVHRLRITMLESVKKRLFAQDSVGLNLRDLQQRLASHVMILVSGFAGLVVLVAFSMLPEGFPLLSLSLCVLGLTLLSWGLLPRLSTIAPSLFICGLAVVLAVALWDYPQPWIPFLVLPLVILATILARGVDLLAALALVAYSLWLNASAYREYPSTIFVLSVLFCLGITWVAAGILRSTLREAWEDQAYASGMLSQSRDQQAQLASVLKSLELATYQLEMANQKLFVARRQTQEAQRAKEQFAANISHELRTPLNIILGFSEMMYVSPDVYGDIAWPTPLRQDVYQIYRSSRHLLSMIDDVLELSRFELARFNLNKEPTEVKTLIQSSVEIVSGLFRDRPIQLVTDIAPGLPVVEVDRTRIRQVIINLVTNARNYAKAGYVRVMARAGEGEVFISVCDTGPGIPEDKLPYIFDAFYQADTSLRREQGGAGLGLAISKQFVEAHEGRIWAESKKGAGTSVYFTLPLPEGGERTIYPRETDSNEPAWRPKRQSIAVLDRDPAVIGLLSRHLEGYDIVPIEDDEHLAKRLAQQQPKIVIRNVPPGRDKPGDANESLPPDLATTYVECSLPSRTWIAADLSISACLTKPVTAEQLMREINRLGPIHDVLVVDDDRGFAQLVERILTSNRSNLNVQLAFDGQEGLETMRAHPPDVIFLDLAMPIMDGSHMLAEISADATLRNIPVILLTVTSYAEDALSRYGSQFLVRRPKGLRLAEVLRCLNAVAGSVDEPQIIEGNER